MDSNLNDSLIERLPSKFKDISYDSFDLKEQIKDSIISIDPKEKIPSICK